MGSPISGTVADIYLQKLEKSIIPKCPKIIFWKRYVDDVFAIIEGDENDAEEIKQLLNSYHHQIQFTMEKECNNEIPFLDILIKRMPDGHIEVYRKTTHTDRYLNYNSFHHKSQKISVVDALTFRAFKICSPIHLEDELNHIKTVLMQNNYPINFINQRIARMRAKFTTTPTHNSISDNNSPITIQILNQENELNLTENRSEDEENKKEEHWVPLPYIQTYPIKSVVS